MNVKYSQKIEVAVEGAVVVAVALAVAIGVAIAEVKAGEIAEPINVAVELAES